MKVIAIVAVDRGGFIGKNGKLPWHLPRDLAYFKRSTQKYPVIMGRKTYESIGKPLSKRQNIVVSRNKDFYAMGCHVVDSVEKALYLAYSMEKEKCFVIGGGQIYKATANKWDLIHITRVDTEVDGGDSRFVDIKKEEWEEIHKQEWKRDAKNPFDATFLVYQRKQFINQKTMVSWT